MQAYEDVLERYKGEAGARPAPAAARGPRLGPPGPAARPAAGGAAGGGRAHPRGAGPGAAAATRGRLRESGAEPPASPARRPPPLAALRSPGTLFALLSGRGRRKRDVELALESGCCGTPRRRRRSWARGREALDRFPGASFPSGGSRGEGGGSPARFCLPASRRSRAGREPWLPGTPGVAGVGGGWVGGWVAWPVSVQISVARPPHPHAAPLDVWACLVEAGV